MCTPGMWTTSKAASRLVADANGASSPAIVMRSLAGIWMMPGSAGSVERRVPGCFIQRREHGGIGACPSPSASFLVLFRPFPTGTLLCEESIIEYQDHCSARSESHEAEN